MLVDVVAQVTCRLGRVEQLAQGRLSLHAGVADRAVRRAVVEEDSAAAAGIALPLSATHILAQIGDGLTSREIGKKLYVSEKTVKSHISRLLARLGV